MTRVVVSGGPSGVSVGGRQVGVVRTSPEKWRPPGGANASVVRVSRRIECSAGAVVSIWGEL
jgi:hypothetical protein